MLTARPIAAFPPQAPAAASAEAFSRFRVNQARAAIRAWHTTALVVALTVFALDIAFQQTHSPLVAMPWSHKVHPLMPLAFAIALSARGTLCAIAWHRDFPKVYPRLGPLLVLVAHASGAVVLSAALFNARAGYAAVGAVYIFAVSILSGLSVRQSAAINAAGLAGIAFGAWLLATPFPAAAPPIASLGLCAAMSGVAAMALESSRRALFLEHYRVSELAVLDGLTGLNNRRAFDAHLRGAWQAAVRGRRMLTLLLVDVDFFKTYNDTLGHVAGDQALRQIAATIQGLARKRAGFVARYGGDEIVVVLLDATAESVIALATRMHDAVSDLALTWQEAGRDRRVTLSSGVAHLRPTGQLTPLHAMLVADEALYAAKRAGRNRFALLDERDAPEAASIFEPGRFRRRD